MTTDRGQRWDAIEVLTRSGGERAQFCAAVPPGFDEAQVDARLVSDVLRSSGRVGDALETRTALVELCAIVRAIDAALGGAITLEELRSGVELHGARTERFAGFHEARVLLRTLDEVLDAGRATAAATATATRAQVELLHAELLEWLVGQLTGGATSAGSHQEHAGAPGDPRAPWRITDPAARQDAHDLLTEVLEGAARHPVTGLLGAAWIRGWSAVPVAGEMLGDDPDEVIRLTRALTLLDPSPEWIVQVDRRRSAPWRIDAATVDMGDGLRDSWQLPAGAAGIRLAAAERPGWTLVTTPTLQFAYLEGAGHHALLGPTDFVEAACGMPVLEAMAAFREHVEAQAVDGEPPEDLLAVAERFGRLRRRSR